SIAECLDPTLVHAHHLVGLFEVTRVDEWVAGKEGQVLTTRPFTAPVTSLANWSVVISPDERPITLPLESSATKYGKPGRQYAFAAVPLAESAMNGVGQGE